MCVCVCERQSENELFKIDGANCVRNEAYIYDGRHDHISQQNNSIIYSLSLAVVVGDDDNGNYCHLSDDVRQTNHTNLFTILRRNHTKYIYTHNHRNIIFLVVQAIMILWSRRDGSGKSDGKDFQIELH